MTKKEEIEKDIKLYDRTLARNPNDHNALSLKAEALVQLSDLVHDESYLKKALDCYNLAVQYAPQDEENLGVYLATRAELHVKMRNPEEAVKDILKANELPGGVMEKAFVSYTAKELLRLDSVKSALNQLQSNPRVPGELLSAIGQLTDVTQNLVVVSGVHEERLDKHDSDIRYIFSLIDVLQNKTCTQAELQQMTSDALLRLDARVTTLAEFVKSLDITCDFFKETINTLVDQSDANKAMLEQKIDYLQTKLTWQNDPELIKTMNTKLLKLAREMKDSRAQISDVINNIDRMNSQIDENSIEIREIESKVVLIEQKVHNSLETLPNIDLLPQLLKGKSDELRLQEEFARLHSDPYTAGLYDSIRSQLNAVWSAAREVGTGIIDHQMASKTGFAGKIMQSVGAKIPIVGSAVSLLGSFISFVDKDKQTEKLHYFAELATNAQDMDLFADSIARKIANTKLDTVALHNTEGIIDRISQYCGTSVTKIRKYVENFFKPQTHTTSDPAVIAKNAGAQDGTIIAGMLISKLYKGDLLGKAHDEVISTLSGDIVTTYREESSNVDCCLGQVSDLTTGEDMAERTTSGNAQLDEVVL